MVRLEVNDWLFNAGLVGIYKILENYYNMNEFKELVKTESNFIELDESVFNNFEEKYFAYFINTYENFTPYGEILSYKNFFEEINRNIEILDEKKLKELNEILKYIKDKLIRNSYKSGYILIEDKSIDILSLLQDIKNIKLKQKISDIFDEAKKQINIILTIILYLRKDEVRKILLAQEFRYNITSDFLSNVSIWKREKRIRNPYEVYNEYFVKIVKEYLESDKKNFKLTCTNCGAKVKNNKFDMTWINKVGADTSKKAAHFWNFSPDIVICPVCNLIYSCIPAGCITLNKKGFFINNNFKMDTLRKLNSLPPKYLHNKNINIQYLETESYFKIADILENASNEQLLKEIENIQIVKLNFENEKRPYTFNVLNKEIALCIYKNKNIIKGTIGSYIKITSKFYLNVYEEILKRIFNNKNLYDLIHELLTLYIKEKVGLALPSMVMEIQKNITELKFNMKRKGEVDYLMDVNLDKQKKEFNIKGSLDYVMFQGYKFRTVYNKKAGNDKKINTVTYKLLNALKTKNHNKLIEILVSSYMYIQDIDSTLKVPTQFGECLKDDNLFLSYGYVFVLGIQGQDPKLKEELDNKNKENGGN